MEISPSIRSCNRARTSERGFALAMALIIAVLYFGLIELMLYDAARELGEARRFRARTVAWVLAENGAELAAARVVTSTGAPSLPIEDWQGTTNGRVVSRNATTGAFTLEGEGTSAAIVSVHAEVTVTGWMQNGGAKIYYTTHTQ